VAVVTAAEAARLEATPELVEPGEFGVCGLVRPTHGWSVPRPGRAAHLRAGRRAGRAGGGPRAHAGRRDPGPGHRRRTGEGRLATVNGTRRFRRARGAGRWPDARGPHAHPG